ncbi:MAG: hypothetical protein Q9174_007144, partial [Haloplaca sp. 1 TL-2023]
MRPSMYVAVGPTAYTVTAILALGSTASKGLPDPFLGEPPQSAARTIHVVAVIAGTFLWLFAFWFFALTSVLVALGSKKLKPNYTWWSFIFPNAGLTLATIQMGKAYDSSVINYLCSVMTAALFAGWLFVSGSLLNAARKGQLGVSDIRARRLVRAHTATGTKVFINGSPSPIPLNIPDIAGSGTRMQNTSPPSSFSLSQTAEIQSALVIASRTLQPGQAITVSGDIISLPTTGTNAVIVDGQAQTLTPAKPSESNGVSDIVFTTGNRSITANLIEVSTATSADNAVETSIDGEGRAEAVTAIESGGEEVQTGSSASGGAPSIAAFEGSGSESLGVRNAGQALW